jgi:DNA-directed RNA polymerase subunit RPC12/RpoP
MKKYVLLGTYDSFKRPSVEIIATSDNPDKLECITDAINQINSKICDDNRITKEIENIIDQYLLEVDLFNETKDHISRIYVLGIFEINKFDRIITTRCTTCEKLIYEGPESAAKYLIIYCTDCAGKVLSR